MKTWIAITVCMALAIAYGCSRQFILEDEEGNVLGTPEQKYKVLSFFFDGVPLPGDEEQNAPGETTQNKNLQKLKYTTHGPYAAKLCEGCHVRGGSNKLIIPVEELCVYCHTIKMDKKMVHGPLASGGCNVCHNPHGSAFPFMLVAKAEEFCLYCHKKEDIEKNEVHKEADANCSECHDAHASDNRFLLK